jgi:hypothetical protein
MSENDYTAQARDAKFDESDTEGSIQTASDESGDTDVYGVISQAVAEQLGEFFEVTVTDSDDVVQAELTGETKNFGKFETPNGAAYGIGIRRDILEDVTGEELPESVGMQFSSSDEAAYEDALEAIDESEEEEAAALVADSDESEDDEEEEVEITDEELDLVEG